jgi:D-alanyl-D-alanine carboxypeptidase/D-alanyl-D-alanine-endopeptidase (penicillin-binding protein 4)
LLNRLKQISFRDWCTAVSPFAVLLLFTLLSCGAKRAGGPGDSGEKPSISNEHFVDTSTFAMHPHYNGWTGDTARALNNLRQQIEQVLSGREFRNVLASTRIVFFEPNNALHDIYSMNASESVLPASTEKLFTSSSTLWALGSKYAFTTKLDLAPGASIQGSHISGNLYLRPSGDPTLRSADLDVLADQLRSKGVTSIQGDIISDLGGENILSPEAKEYMAEHNLQEVSVHDSMVGDNGMIVSADSTSSDSASENSDEDEESEAGVLSSFPNFALDRNIVAVTVIGGGGKGSPLSVRVYPPISSVVVQNNGSSSAPALVRSRTVGRGRHRRTARSISRGVMTLHVASSGGPTDAQQTITISGQLPARQQRTYSFPLRNVPMAMAAVMKWRLQQAGIAVSGRPRVDRAPANTPLQTVANKETSLLDLLTQMNKRSDNYLAESMFRKLSTIATVAATAPDERARNLMRSWLQVCNVDGTQCTFIDGSGLSKADRVSANTVVNLLASIEQQGMLPLFTHTLSVAGYDGTLRHRMIGTPAQYNAHGKTGTLNAVTALAGYVVTGDGQLAAYFITMQKFRGGPWTYKRDQDKIVETLANFKYADYQSAATMPTLGDTGENASER